MEVCVEAGPDRLPAAVVKVWVGRRGVEEGEEEEEVSLSTFLYFLEHSRRNKTKTLTFS